MADKKISELGTAAAVYDADDFALVQDGDTKQVNASAVKTYVKDGLSKSDVGLGNVDNTSDANKPVSTATQTALDLKQDAASAATLTGTQTLANKTISGSSNTLSNIGNSSLTNSSITINGNAVSLGGSTTVSAATTNTLTIGTGLSGTSFNGSAATTIAIDSSVVTLTGAQTLTNKTLTSPVISGGTANNVAIGGTTPAAGAFTTLSSTGNTTLGDASGDTLTINAGTTTFAQGTANGVLYLNGSKVATSGSGLVFDGTNFGVGTSSPKAYLQVGSGSITPSSATGATIQHPYTPILSLLAPSATAASARVTFGTELSTQAASILYTNSTGILQISSSGGSTSGNIAFSSQGSEVMRLTYTGLGIGTSSPTKQLHLYAATPEIMLENSGGNDWVIKNYQGKFLLNDATTGQDRFILDSSGNVGIGTSSLSNPLDVKRDSATSFNATTDQRSQAKAVFRNESELAGYFSGVSLITGSGYQSEWSINNVWTANYLGSLVFKTRIGSTTWAERLRIDSSGNLGLGVTPSAWSSTYRVLQNGTSAFVRATNSDYTAITTNIYNDGTAKRIANGFAAEYSQLNGTHSWFVTSNDAAGNPVATTASMYLSLFGNLGLGTTSFGTSAAKVLSIANGTAPTSGPADTVQFYSSDRSAGNTIPSFYCEGSGVVVTSSSNTVQRKIAMRINGTIYYLLASTDAT